MAIPLYLFTGFLGSGKTSVINSLLGHLNAKKIGLILNDFGSITVDSALVEGAGEIIATTSLSGGQIFCSCLSGSFVDAVEKMANMDLDAIIVEASGLAKPAPLLEIIAIIQQRSAYKIAYSGMICVIDAERYPILSQSLKTLEEQVVFSDWFIVNKTDLVDADELATLDQTIKGLRPLAPLFMTTYGQISPEMLALMEGPQDTVAIESIDASNYSGWGVYGRPKNCVFLPRYPFDVAHLKEFLEKISTQLLRMKGFIPTEEGKALLVDAVGPHIKVSEVKMPPTLEPGVMCIYAANVATVDLINKEWQASAFSCYETP